MLVEARSMSAKSRQERARKRERRARRREEADRRLKAALLVAARAREERLARLGPLVEMYGDGSELLCAADRLLRVRGDIVLYARPTTRPVKRVYRPDGSVTLVHEHCGSVTEARFAGGGWVEERK
jgi:hypothetical protein